MNQAILLLCGLSVVALSFGPFVAGIVHLALLKSCPPYTEWYRVRVTSAFTALRDDGRHWEACRQAERYYGALGRVRGKVRMHLMLQWLESAALAHDPRALHLAAYLIDHGHYVANAHEYAGVVCAGNGFAAEAEQHYAVARDLYDKEDKPKSQARVLARMANLSMLDGRFDEARALYPHILKNDPDAHWRVTVIESTICGNLGQYVEVLSLVRQAMQNEKPKNKSHLLILTARAEVCLEDVASAQQHLQEVSSLSPNDESVVFSAATLTARILAMQKRKPEAMALLRQTEKSLGRYVAARLPNWPSGAVWPPHAQPPAAPGAAWPPPPKALPTNDRDSRREIAAFTPRVRVHDFCLAKGRTAFELGEYDQSLHSWHHLFLCKPNRVSVAYANYYIGECWRALGDSQSAAEAYRAAVDVGIGTLYTERARARLQESEAAP